MAPQAPKFHSWNQGALYKKVCLQQFPQFPADNAEFYFFCYFLGSLLGNSKSSTILNILNGGWK